MSSICRRNISVEESEDARCCSCDGNHVPEFTECPVRLKEVKVARIRAVAYAEAVEIVEGESRDVEAMTVDEILLPLPNPQRLCRDLSRHLKLNEGVDLRIL